MAEDKQTVFVTGAPGSRRFDKIHEFVDRGMAATSRIESYKVEATIDGQTYDEDLGKYPKEKWPDSKQTTRPIFLRDAGRFVIRHADGREWSSEELDAFVKANPQRHPKMLNGEPNPRAGQEITTVNLYDPDDPYMNSEAWVTRMTEGETEFVTTHTDKFRISTLRGNPEFMDETTDGIRSGEVNYLIRQPEVAEKREEEKREAKELAFDLYRGMKDKPRKMLAILRLMQVDFDDDATASTLRTALFKKIDDDTRAPNGVLWRELFVRYADLPEDELALRETVSLAAMRKIIFERAGIYEFQGAALGTTFDAVLDHLRKLENGAILEAIRMKIESKK